MIAGGMCDAEHVRDGLHLAPVAVGDARQERAQVDDETDQAPPPQATRTMPTWPPSGNRLVSQNASVRRGFSTSTASMSGSEIPGSRSSGTRSCSRWSSACGRYAGTCEFAQISIERVKCATRPASTSCATNRARCSASGAPTRSSSSRVGGPDTHDHHIVMVMPGCQTRAPPPGLAKRQMGIVGGGGLGRRSPSALTARACASGLGRARTGQTSKRAWHTSPVVAFVARATMVSVPDRPGNSDLKAERAAWRNGAPRVGENANRASSVTPTPHSRPLRFIDLELDLDPCWFDSVRDDSGVCWSRCRGGAAPSAVWPGP